ncbi:MAG: VOC family protein, partial [Chitinophagaceae bacterium]|nr:VOC family protein [Chitinophagaceae bacterium]
MKKILLALACAFVMIVIPKLLFAQSKPVLNHIALYVKNLQVSTAFYSDVVGIDTIPEPFHDGKHTWYGISANSHLHLIQGAKEITS